MEFLKTSDIALNPAGYLINKTTKKPVDHKDFVTQQKAAEYVIKLAEAIKDKNFTVGKADNLEEIKAAVMASINAKNVKEYAKAPTKPTSKIQDELTQHALDFVNYYDKSAEAEQINKLMDQFSAIEAIESVGDYFSEGLTKLNAIYSIKEILAAVKINAEKMKSI
jgi:hypothetical protein